LVNRIESQLNVRENGMFLVQPQPNPRIHGGVNEVKNIQVEHAKLVTILKSGKIVNKEYISMLPHFPKGCLHLKRGQQIKIFWKCLNR
jgi:hypothetical protein